MLMNPEDRNTEQWNGALQMLSVPPWQGDTTDCPDLAEDPEPHQRALMKKEGGSDEFFLQTGRAHVIELVKGLVSFILQLVF